MALGTPVVAAGGGGHLESVGEVAGAALFVPGDAAGAARHLDRLGLDPAERERLGAAQLAYQRRHLRAGDHAEALAAVYAAVRAERRRPGRS
jgi:glycosyltransferase involved in cell wall biosynthesis